MAMPADKRAALDAEVTRRRHEALNGEPNADDAAPAEAEPVDEAPFAERVDDPDAPVVWVED